MYVIGTGPGDPRHLTLFARNVLASAEVVFGYGPYLDRIASLLGSAEVRPSRMTREVERVTRAVETALSGRVTAIVSGGDPGIYAMAGLVFEVCKQRKITTVAAGTEAAAADALPVAVIPGVPALSAGAARLGAPLMHDFAAISLSDLLTPWETIEKRIEAAAEADFVIVLYNPKSKRRSWQLHAACTLIARHRSPETPVGIVANAMRENETVTLTSLQELPDAPVDMQTTVFIGNSGSFQLDGFLVTPRGYGNKYDLGE